MTRERKLLLATTNPGKFRDMKMTFQDLAQELSFDVVSPQDLSDTTFSIEETGTTFSENALLKARSAAEHFGLPTVADDGGLEIDALSGKPGVFSRRWPGYAVDDETLIRYAMDQMRDVPEGNRGAQFRTVSAFVAPEGKEATAEGILRGVIATNVHENRDAGYPFRSIFILFDIGKYMTEISDDEENRLSHRRKSLLALMPTVRDYFSHP